MIEIKFKGRGGQGAVVASEILGRALFLEGKYPQCFSLFGGERRGAPVVGFLRVDEEPILLKCQIKHPDQMIIFDLSLADEKEVFRELKPKGFILINSNREIGFFKNFRGYRIGLIDASLIARKAGLGGTFNTAMLGAYIRLTQLVKMQTLIEAVRGMVPTKIELNIEAVKEAYEQAKGFEIEE
ncbi:MAG TPA: 2-oxoacid:acceptor oxidoreductase family protein [Thermodesulfobacteriota bacterium]|jgi:2-oxoacid:acceptor oxidoreductase gamma subunit (pyruvate/2-ketoisovalerate family)|nr:2-oxoacid:acceptor oxidoreductase family protein [Thermodesulfobacteriota bacterium]